jgi:hypothetical protein
MIFGHMQKPLGMRNCRIGKRIYVQRVPLDTTWFYPYCCATVDKGCVTLRGAGRRTHPCAPAIQACQTNRILGADLICFALVGIDEPYLMSFGHQ